jgi:hypothetical protein
MPLVDARPPLRDNPRRISRSRPSHAAGGCSLMVTTIQAHDTAELVAKAKAHHVNPVSNLRQVREHGPLVIARGEGVHVWDTDGNRYVDGFAGLWNVNVGHGRRELAAAMAAQAEEIAFSPTFFGLATPPTIGPPRRRSSWPPAWRSSSPAI